MKRFVAAPLCASLLALLAWAAGPARAAQALPPPVTAPPVDLGPALQAILAEHDLPGLAVVALQGGRIAACGYVGVRRRGSPEAIARGDCFHLGSCTKAMTATLAALLVDEGRLSWSSTVGGVFADSIPGMDPGWSRVTLLQFLNHRSGASDDRDWQSLSGGGLWARLQRREGTPTAQRLVLLQGIMSRPPAHPPGAVYMYSNFDYVVVGAMAERVTGRSWEDLMRERLFGPLHLASAGFGAPGSPSRLDEPWGHTEQGDPKEPGPGADNPPALAPAGAVHMDMEDWARFVSLHLRGDAHNPDGAPSMVSAGSLAVLHAPGRGMDQGRYADPLAVLRIAGRGTGQKYACGWIPTHRSWAKGDRPGDAGVALWHNGSNTLWYCVTWLAPERDFAVLAACNQGGREAAKACDQAAAMVMLKMLGSARQP